MSHRRLDDPILRLRRNTVMMLRMRKLGVLDDSILDNGDALMRNKFLKMVMD